MRIYHDDCKPYIHALAKSVSKDPASLARWRCLHAMTPVECERAPLIRALKSAKATHGELDCDVVLCDDNDLLLISKDLPSDAMHALARELLLMAGGVDADITLYSVFPDWRAIRPLLLAKTNGEPAKHDSATTINFGDTSSLADVFSEARQRRPFRKPLHVMIVEDDALTRRVVNSCFKENYAMISAQNAQEAVANYLLHAPDIVFLDIGLPDASGLQVLRQIVACDPEAFVVMFSSNDYLDNITDALNHGASGFVGKPFKKDSLEHYIHECALHHHKTV